VQDSDMPKTVILVLKGEPQAAEGKVVNFSLIIVNLSPLREFVN